MKKIRKGDEVMVLTGRNKSSRGKVLRVLDDERVVVEGVNLVKRHTRPNPQMGQPGGIIEKEAPIHVSNVAIYNAATGKPDRVGFKMLEDGRKVRVARRSGVEIDG